MSPLRPHIEALTSTTFEETRGIESLFEGSREEPERVLPVLDAWLGARLGIVGPEAAEIPWFEQLVGRWRGSGRSAFESEDASLSYDDLHRATARRALAWRAQGVQQGTMVCVCRPFGVQYVLDLLTGFRIGACVAWVAPQGEPYERRGRRAVAADFVSGEVAVLRRSGADLSGVPLVSEAQRQLLPEADGTARYGRKEPCLRVLSPKAALEPTAGGELPSWAPTSIDCESLQRAVARDATLVWLLRPGDSMTAPGFDGVRHQPALLLACLLAGATYHHITPEEVDRRSPRLRRTWRAFGLCEATVGSSVIARSSAELCEADLWFRDLEATWEPALWHRFGRSAGVVAPLFCGVLMDPAIGGVALATERSSDVSDNRVRVALGTSFEVTPLEGAAPDAADGLLRIAESAGAPYVLLSRLRGERYRHLGSWRPRRAGAVYPRDVVVEAVATVPGVIGATVVSVPRGGERTGSCFGLVVFVCAPSNWSAERERRVERAVEAYLCEVLAPEILPDFVECRPLLPLLDEAGVVDEGWVTLQRFRGRLRQKAELAVFRKLGGALGSAADSVLDRALDRALGSGAA